MRLSLCFFMLILLPVATGVHAWLFCSENLPVLTEEAVARLKAAGVRDPVVEVRFFDIAVSGEAPDPPARQQALAAEYARATLVMPQTSFRNVATGRVQHPPPVRLAVPGRFVATLLRWVPK